MTDEEATEVFNELSSQLQGEGFEWVVDQVLSEIDTGIEIEKNIDSYREQNDRFVKSTKISTTGVIAYSPKAQLKLLLSATEKAIVDPTEMAMAALDTLSKLYKKKFANQVGLNAIDILFESDKSDRRTTVVQGASVEVSVASIRVQVAAVKVLRERMIELRSQIDAT